ncbi:MAG TPA: ATP-binding protein [Verrucomicrobiae bacterium]|nr:ATP-binding protein [Verrucomicrobiae bacterium]
MNIDHRPDTRAGGPVAQTQGEKVEAFRLAAIIEYSDDAIISKTVDGIIIGWNHGAERLYGFMAEEIIGSPIAILYPPDHYQEYLATMKEVKAGRKVPAFDTVRRRKDGSLVNVSVGFTPIEAHDGQILGASKNSHDITRLKKLEAQVIEAQKMEVIGHLASGVAHDFNNILAVIMCYSDLIRRDLTEESPLRMYTEQIMHAADRASGLTRQLLVFSRKQTVQAVVLDINTTVIEIDKMLRRLIDENIAMTIVPGKEIGRVKADSGYIGQVLINLVVNARDAMPEGGRLTIATENVALDEAFAKAHPGVMAGDYVMLSVTDTGTGMTDQVKARLFEAFFTTKPKGKGTGLGLATCRTIMQQSGGHIDVDSEIGRGTTFKVYFPRVQEPLAITATQPPPGPLPRGKETLLVVEDEPSVRHLACSILEKLGYTVLLAANGQDGVRMAERHKGSQISLVITDVIMPLMGGKEMAEWLKATYPTLKILLTSGYMDESIHHKSLEPGVLFLPKPYTPASLARTVRAMLDDKTEVGLLQKMAVAVPGKG